MEGIVNMIDILGIMEIIPHRYPFLLVDRIIEKEDGQKIVGIKNVTMNEEFFQGHFPGHPVMPGVLIVEGLAQTLGVLMMTPGTVPYFMSIESAKFRRPVRPGDQLRYELEVLKVKGKVIKAAGKATVDGVTVAEAVLMFSIVEK
jgi:beta-hydroxyacyl-ACP dehydratase FabZ